MDDRKYWLKMLLKMASPVLHNFANGTLHRELGEEITNSERKAFMGLEILGRTLSGIAPWLEVSAQGEEEQLRQEYAALTRQALTQAVDPVSPDYCFTGTDAKEWNVQYLVDAGFLAMAIVRAPRELGKKLPADVRHNLIKAFHKTRNYRPVFNNWLLFSAMVEAALYVLGEDYDLVRVDYALRQMEQWYQGDGFYGDGPRFRMDYYNSFTLQPMLLHLVKLFYEKYQEDDLGKTMYQLTMMRFQKFVSIQEHSVAPDGSYPPYGRSLTYRCGAFHALAMAAWLHDLPQTVSPAMARGALTKVIRKTLDAPETFTDTGWLTPGVCGCQPNMVSHYVTTASLYMATLAFLPLGLPEDDPFWSAPEEKSTWEKCFTGENLMEEIAIEEDIALYR